MLTNAVHQNFSGTKVSRQSVTWVLWMQCTDPFCIFSLDILASKVFISVDYRCFIYISAEKFYKGVYMSHHSCLDGGLHNNVSK